MNGHNCKTASCGGVIQDGYCDTCGNAPAVEVKAAAHAASVSTVAPPAVAVSNSVVNGAKCSDAACAGQYEDGFCNTCGNAAAVPSASSAASAAQGAALSHRTGGSRISNKTSGTALSGVASATSTRVSRGTRVSSSQRQLGLGLVAVPVIPKSDPLKALMAEAKVPANKRICGGYLKSGDPCGNVLDKREKGFCPKCQTKYNFIAGLDKGELVAGQYEVLGCIAFGGMGWIYLAKDVTLARYVVLKGLVNQDDKALAEAAVAERQFLAEVKHANIVGVYTCVQHANAKGSAAYTVMEYVGGRTLKSLRKERGPLPVSEVLAYMHCVLGAFAYMHRIGLIYNDFKPDNVMLEVDDIKVIDLGGVTRASNTDGDIYSTVGYAAPELATKGPSPASDIYTLARTMAVLCTEFKGFQNTNEHKLLTPSDEPVYAQYESFYRFLLKATHENPNMRFQSADEMDEQLLGVMRDAVAIDAGKPCPGNSSRFGYDRLLEREAAQQQVVDIHSLPRLRMDTQDPAATIILNGMGGGTSADLKRQEGVIVSALEQYPDSHEAKLALARNQIEQGQFDKAEAALKEIEAVDAFDWRVIWYRGVSFLARGQYDGAASAFDTCFDEVPGELAPRLALGVVSELKKSVEDAIHFYRSVSRVDAGYATALFGQARLLAAQGKTNEAVVALAMVPQTSSLYVDAQKALAKILIGGGGKQPAADDLNRAAQTIEALVLTGIEKLTMLQELFTAALGYVTSKQGALKLLDKEVPEMEVRTRLEAACRDLARLAHDEVERIRLVDLANQVRPRTAF
ncbi:serine/threonine-protein kinase [soil metagenome]